MRRFAGDTFFPSVNWEKDWQMTEDLSIKKGLNTPYNLWFSVFERYRKP
jgi:hypothetical protein